MSKPTNEQIHAQIDASQDSDCFGMTYEEGVRTALNWVLDSTNEAPIEEE